MTKNITVIDENGNRIGSTYPKRALGLVKKGRAHWIGKDSVCLCAHNTEEIKMPNNIYDVIDNQFSKLQGQFNCIENNDRVAIAMMETLADMQNKSRMLELIEKQLSVLNEEIKNEPAADDSEKLAVMREITKQQQLKLLIALAGGAEAEPAEQEPVKAEAAKSDIQQETISQ